MELNEESRIEKPARPRMRVCITFIAIHLVLITSMVVYQAFDAYPGWTAGLWDRLIPLREMYSELEEYKKRTGDFPKSIDSLLRYNEKENRVFFGSEALSFVFDPANYVEKIEYRLVDGEPVISDLGDDREKGGLGADMDVAYPDKYREPFLFRDFMKTEEFSTFLLYGVLMASGISLCLYGMWRKSLAAGLPWILIAVAGSIAFLIFELYLAAVILIAHLPMLYPHH